MSGPEPGPGQIVGVALVVVFVFLLIFIVGRISASDGPWRLFWSVVGLSALALSISAAILAVRLRSLQYAIHPMTLVIRTTGQRLEIPLADIVDVTYRPRDRIDIEGYERFWPGFYDGLNMTSEGYWRTLATAPPNERVRLRLASGLTIAISPARPILFVEALEARRAGRTLHVPRNWDDAAPAAVPAPAAVEGCVVEDAPPIPGSPEGAGQSGDAIPASSSALTVLRERIIRGDPVASNLLALSVLTLIVLGFIAGWKGDTVNQPLPVHWNEEGQPAWFVRPDGFWVIEGLWIYPFTASAVVAVNTALATLAAAFERMPAARLLLAGAFVVGLMFIVAMSRATGVV